MLEERMLTPILNGYFDGTITPGYETRERISTIGNMQIIIYSNDHNPPHFHVKSMDGKVDAKFKIENCDFLSGTIRSKDEKKVKEFYKDIKTQLVMKRIWGKRKE